METKAKRELVRLLFKSRFLKILYLNIIFCGCVSSNLITNSSPIIFNSSHKHIATNLDQKTIKLSIFVTDGDNDFISNQRAKQLENNLIKGLRSSEQFKFTNIIFNQDKKTDYSLKIVIRGRFLKYNSTGNFLAWAFSFSAYPIEIYRNYDTIIALTEIKTGKFLELERSSDVLFSISGSTLSSNEFQQQLSAYQKIIIPMIFELINAH